ncbi:hypothetical protein DCAR_0103312 [Daucus carota subsp. sativus]|uniref:Uncharacterized protein n=1 Tax=Daucus carota subsp. sativus TaxID=79200 RepID=A0A175YAC6_DAUCS|nr:hypothetical protein DCAR_0103312 [Daucus carota subsp. sativus]
MYMLYVPTGWKKLCKHKMEARTNHISEFLRRIQTNDSTSPSPTYLAQHPLFDQIVGKKYVRLCPASLSGELCPLSE